MLSQGWPPSESGKAMPERLAAMAGSWRGALSALRSPWGHREDAAPSPRPQALARSPLSDKNPAPRPVGREGLLQQGRWAWPKVTEKVMTHQVWVGVRVAGRVHVGSWYPLPASRVPIASSSPCLSLAQEMSFNTCGKGSWSLLIRRIQREKSDSRPHPWLGE